MAGLIRNAVVLALPWKRRQMLELDNRYGQARALGMGAVELKAQIAIMQTKYPSMNKLEAIDAVIEQLRKGES